MVTVPQLKNLPKSTRFESRKSKIENLLLSGELGSFRLTKFSASGQLSLIKVAEFSASGELGSIKVAEFSASGELGPIKVAEFSEAENSKIGELEAGNSKRRTRYIPYPAGIHQQM